jgi:hypothetical protein
MWNESVVSFIHGILYAFARRDRGQTRKPSIRIVGVSTEIRIGRKLYRLSELIMPYFFKSYTALMADSVLPQVHVFLFNEYKLKLILINNYFAISYISL